MKDFAEKFYSSRNWKSTRNAYIKSVGGLCELCLKTGKYSPARIVHHKIPLSPETINDPKISLNWDNFLAVCMKCHAELHRGDIVVPKDPVEAIVKPAMQTKARRYVVDDVTGAVTILE